MSNEIKKDQIPTEQNGMNNSSAIRDAEELSDIENEAAANVVHDSSGEKTENGMDSLTPRAEGKSMRRAVRLRKASQSRDGEEGQEKKSPRKNAGRRTSLLLNPRTPRFP